MSSRVNDLERSSYHEFSRLIMFLMIYNDLGHQKSWSDHHIYWSWFHDIWHDHSWQLVICPDTITRHHLISCHDLVYAVTFHDIIWLMWSHKMSCSPDYIQWWHFMMTFHDWFIKRLRWLSFWIITKPNLITMISISNPNMVIR